MVDEWIFPKTSTKTTAQLKDLYADAVEANPFVNALCPSHVECVIAALVCGEQESLGALDSVYKTCLLDNGKDGRSLITELAAGRPDVAQRLSTGLTEDDFDSMPALYELSDDE
jgi:hypothetical protein